MTTRWEDDEYDRDFERRIREAESRAEQERDRLQKEREYSQYRLEKEANRLAKENNYKAQSIIERIRRASQKKDYNIDVYEEQTSPGRPHIHINQPKVTKVAPMSSQQSEDTNTNENNDIVDLSKKFYNLNYRMVRENMNDESNDIRTKINDLEVKIKNTDMAKVLLGVIQDLVRDGGNDMVLIKHDTARQLYEKYADILKQIEETTEICNERDAKRQAAKNKLTQEERDLLGIK